MLYYVVGSPEDLCRVCSVNLRPLNYKLLKVCIFRIINFCIVFCNFSVDRRAESKWRVCQYDCARCSTDYQTDTLDHHSAVSGGFFSILYIVYMLCVERGYFPLHLIVCICLLRQELFLLVKYQLTQLRQLLRKRGLIDWIQRYLTTIAPPNVTIAPPNVQMHSNNCTIM